MNTPGNKGTASLVLRVPVDACRGRRPPARQARRGEGSARAHPGLDGGRQTSSGARSVALQATIAKLERTLAAGGLSPDVRLRLQYQLDEAKRTLAQKTKTRANTVREGTLATVSLAFSTPEAGTAVAPHHPGRLERAARDTSSSSSASSRGSSTRVIVLAPIALLAAALVFGVRAGRRRSEDRAAGAAVAVTFPAVVSGALDRTQARARPVGPRVRVTVALISAMLIPRSRPEFPGRNLGWFVFVSILFFIGMMTAVLVFGE